MLCNECQVKRMKMKDFPDIFIDTESKENCLIFNEITKGKEFRRNTEIIERRT